MILSFHEQAIGALRSEKFSISLRVFRESARKIIGGRTRFVMISMGKWRSQPEKQIDTWSPERSLECALITLKRLYASDGKRSISCGRRIKFSLLVFIAADVTFSVLRSVLWSEHHLLLLEDRIERNGIPAITQLGMSCRARCLLWLKAYVCSTGLEPERAGWSQEEPGDNERRSLGMEKIRSMCLRA